LRGLIASLHWEGAIPRLTYLIPMYDSAATPFKSPKRVSITIPYAVYDYLMAMSDEQGRSLSNYAAHLLEISMLQRHNRKNAPG